MYNTEEKAGQCSGEGKILWQEEEKTLQNQLYICLDHEGKRSGQRNR